MLAITATTASIWTAIGTGALALATFVSLFFARRALNKTQAQIELGQSQLKQTQEDIELSRKEVEEAHRPVVVPVADSRTIKIGVAGRHQEHEAVPFGWPRDVLTVPLENIGAGPALNVEMSIRLLDVEDRPSAPQKTLAAMAGLGKDELVPLQIHAPYLKEHSNFELTITYDDVAGKGWLTVGRWNVDEGRYTDLTFNTQAEGPYGLKQDGELVKPVPPGG